MIVTRQISFFIITVILIVGISSCKSKKQKTHSNDKQSYTYTEVSKGSRSNISEEKYVVIKDNQSFNKIYQSINQTRQPDLSIPSVDFDNQYILALFLGLKNTGGYSISIDSIYLKSNEIIVKVKEKKPKGMTTMALTTPYYFAKIKKTEKSILFIK